LVDGFVIPEAGDATDFSRVVTPVAGAGWAGGGETDGLSVEIEAGPGGLAVTTFTDSRVASGAFEALEAACLAGFELSGADGVVARGCGSRIETSGTERGVSSISGGFDGTAGRTGSPPGDKATGLTGTDTGLSAGSSKRDVVGTSMAGGSAPSTVGATGFGVGAASAKTDLEPTAGAGVESFASAAGVCAWGATLSGAASGRVPAEGDGSVAVC
jgi:hypothetical protein